MPRIVAHHYLFQDINCSQQVIEQLIDARISTLHLRSLKLTESSHAAHCAVGTLATFNPVGCFG